MNAKKIISLLLLAVFISMQGSSLHVWSHDDDGDGSDCSVCEYVIASEDDDIIVPQVTVAVTPVLVPFNTILPQTLISKRISSTVVLQHLSRPPPSC